MANRYRVTRLEDQSAGGANYVPYTNADGVVLWLAPGAAGKVLKSNGAGTPPSWEDDNSGAGTPTFVGARVYHSANQSLATSGTIQALAFNSERYDTDAFHDTATNNSRLTVPSGKAGKYLIEAHIEIEANATGVRQLAIRIGGSTYIASQVQNAVGSSTVTHMSISVVYALAVGDYAECMAMQSSGSARNVIASGNYSPEFSISLLGA